jgi:CRP/FNR family cyclic AMP-dependent transcriptional regulator
VPKRVQMPADRFDARAFLAKLDGGITPGKYAARKPVFRQGDPCDSLFYVEQGQVKLTVVSARGKEAVVAILGPGDFMGEECLAEKPRRFSTATTLSESTIMRIDKDSAIRGLRAEPQFSELFLSYVLERNIRAQEDLVDQLFNSSEKRLARVLLLLANYYRDDQPANVHIGKISQETLAEMVGTTRSRVSYFMNKFRKLGFIQYNGGLQVHRSLMDVVLHD